MTIDIQETLLFEQKAVYTRDNSQYLYTHFHIRVKGVVNPSLPTTPGRTIAGAVAPGPLPTVALAIPNTDAAGNVVTRPTISPAIAVNQIRAELQVPRKPLIFALGDLNANVNLPPGPGVLRPPGPVVQLRSPRMKPGTNQFYDVDSKNGPMPIGVPDILQINGDRSMIVVFEVETWLNEATRTTPGGGPSGSGGQLCLAHRWEETQEIDEDFYTTRTVNGVAIFDASVLASMTAGLSGVGIRAGNTSAVPDDFRSTFFHPIPLGYQRKGIQVTATEDGLSIVYSFIDEQTPYILSYAPNGLQNRPITRFRGFYRVAAAFPGGFARIAVDSIHPGGLWEGVFNSIIGDQRTAADIRRAIVNALAKRTAELQLTVFGSPTATRRDLINALRTVVGAYGFLPAGSLTVQRAPLSLFSSVNGHCEISLESRVASYYQRVTTDLFERALQNQTFNAATQVLPFGIIDADEIRAPLLDPAINGFTNDPVQGGFAVGNPQPPGDKGTRGVSPGLANNVASALERCVAQSLSDPFVNPTQASGLTTTAIGTRTTSFDYNMAGGL